jgi:hypothetical protein
MNEHVITFRPRMLPSFLYIIVYSQLGFLVVAVLLGVVGFVLEPEGPSDLWLAFYLSGSVGIGVLSILATPLVVWGYPVYILADGLKGYNFWGIYSTIPWNAITAVRPLYLGVVVYARVFSPRIRLPLWLPLFLDDMERFTNLVRDRAGLDHPLTVVLEGATTIDDA